MVSFKIQLWRRFILKRKFRESIEQEEQLKFDSKDTLGGRLTRAREAAGLSTVQLARRIGVTTDSLDIWERDQDEPRVNKLVTISGVLNVSPTWLMCGVGDGPSELLVLTEMKKTRSDVGRLRQTIISVAEDLKNIEQRLECYNNHQD